jgi:hypothetical protein
MFELPPTRTDRAADEPVDLSTVTPGWSTVIGRDSRPIGFRLALSCPAAGRRAPGASLATLLQAVLDGFVAEGATGLPHGLVVLAPRGIGVDESLRGFRAPRNVLLEIGQGDLGDEDRPGARRGASTTRPRCRPSACRCSSTWWPTLPPIRRRRATSRCWR